MWDDVSKCGSPSPPTDSSQQLGAILSTSEVDNSASNVDRDFLARVRHGKRAVFLYYIGYIYYHNLYGTRKLIEYLVKWPTGECKELLNICGAHLRENESLQWELVKWLDYACSIRFVSVHQQAAQFEKGCKSNECTQRKIERGSIMNSCRMISLKTSLTWGNSKSWIWQHWEIKKWAKSFSLPMVIIIFFIPDSTRV